MMNTKLVEAITQIFFSLPKDERALLREKLWHEFSEPQNHQFIQQVQDRSALDFLHDQPDIFTLADGDLIL
jgi:hypothetical protein